MRGNGFDGFSLRERVAIDAGFAEASPIFFSLSAQLIGIVSDFGFAAIALVGFRASAGIPRIAFGIVTASVGEIFKGADFAFAFGIDNFCDLESEIA